MNENDIEVERTEEEIIDFLLSDTELKEEQFRCFKCKKLQPVGQIALIDKHLHEVCQECLEKKGE